MSLTCPKKVGYKDGKPRWERRATGSSGRRRKQPELASPMALVDERGGGAQIRECVESGEWVVFGGRA